MMARPTATENAEAALAEAVFAEDDEAAERARIRLVKADPRRAAHRAMQHLAHRQESYVSRMAATRRVLGTAPESVMRIIEGAGYTYRKRSGRAWRDKVRRRNSVPRRALRMELERLFQTLELSLPHKVHVTLVVETQRSRGGYQGDPPRSMRNDILAPTASCKERGQHRYLVVVADWSLFDTPREARTGPGWFQLTPELRVCKLPRSRSKIILKRLNPETGRYDQISKVKREPVSRRRRWGNI